MKILIITYPVSPFRGSEFAVSWDFITNMSQHHELFVLYGTSGNGFGNISELSGWLSTHHIKNVHFIDVQLEKTYMTTVCVKLREINYKYGSFFQYKLWHKQVYQEAKQIIEKNQIDIVHYLNPIGFKEPSECWKINDKPYIWGPMQGVENRPFCLYKALGAKGVIDAICRLILHNAILYLSPKIRKAVKRTDCLFAATPRTVLQIEKFNKETIYLPENGIQTINRNNHISLVPEETLKIIWVGTITYRKGLILLIEALRKVRSKKWQLDICGNCPNAKYLQKLQHKAEKYGIQSHINWHGSIPRTQVNMLFSNAHLHIISSLGEATTTVLWEAMSWAIPTMSLDHCGMSGVICEKCGIKVPIHSYKQVINELSSNIENIIENPKLISNLSKGTIECSKNFLWRERCKIFNSNYSKIIKQYK